jgi:hypothetical protein
MLIFEEEMKAIFAGKPFMCHGKRIFLTCFYDSAVDDNLTSRGSLTSGCTGGYSHSVIFMTNKPLTGLWSLTILPSARVWPIFLP